MSLKELRGLLERKRTQLNGMQIAVLAGGVSSEREVALASGRAVASALGAAGLNVQLIEVDHDSISKGNLIEQLRSSDLVFTTMHGTEGEDGIWQGLFELLRLPYVSAGVRGSVLAMDKLTSKRIFDQLCIPTPFHLAVYCGERPDEFMLDDVLGDALELVAKPTNQGSSVGITMVDNDDEGWGEIAELSKQYDPLIVEERIYGRELTCGIIGPCDNPVVLPLVEIKPKHDYYDHTAKYTEGGSEYVCPAQVTSDHAEAISMFALAIYEELDLEPYARMDCILDDNGIPWFLEANTLPGFTALSLLPMAAKAAGIEFDELCQILMACALERWERQGGSHAA